MVDHRRDITNGKEKNAMVKHMINCHSNNSWKTDVPVRARPVKYHNKTLNRVIDECLRLEQNQGLANSKGEWGRGGGMVRSHSSKTNDPGGGGRN